MYARITNLMAWRAGLLMAGCAEALTREHLYPFAVYFGDRLQAMPSAAELAQTYRTIHRALTTLGAKQLEARVVAVGLPKAGRFRIWVDWWAELDDGSCRLVAQTVEYMRETAEGSRCEMTECSGWALPASIAAR